MNDPVAPVFHKGARKCLAIPNVAFDKLRALARDAFDPAQYLGLAVAEIIEDNDGPTGSDKLNAGMRSDITCASCDHDRHRNISPDRHRLIHASSTKQDWPNKHLS